MVNTGQLIVTDKNFTNRVKDNARTFVRPPTLLLSFELPQAKELKALGEYTTPTTTGLSCADWLCSLKKSSRRTYMTHLRLFCIFYGVDPDILAGLTPEQLKEMLIKYCLYLNDVALPVARKPAPGFISVNTVEQYFSGLKSYVVDWLEKPIFWKKISRLFPDKVDNDLRSYTKEEIRYLHDQAGEDYRCIIALMAQSGLRVGAFQDLKVKHLIRLDHGYGLLQVYPNSAEDRYLTIVHPETMADLDTYFALRRRWEEKITPESPLIRSKYGAMKATEDTGLFHATIRAQIRRLMERGGLDMEHLQPDHSFRYYYNTTLKNCKVTWDFKELLMGHDVGLDKSYYDENDPISRQTILEEYMKAAPSLALSNEKRLEVELAKVTAQRDEGLSSLRKEIEEMKAMFGK